MTGRPDESQDLHVLLGAFVLGGLSDEDHRAFTEHLRTCAQCQQEMGQVSGLPRLLELAAWEAPPEQSESGLPTLFAAVRQRRRRDRWLRLAAAVVIGALCLVGGLLGGRSLGSAPEAAQPERPTVRYSAVAAAGSPVHVEVALVTRGWGTQFEIDCEEMPKDGQLTLWVVDRTGRETAVASWHATTSGYATVTGAAAIRPPEVRALEIRTAAGEVIATAQT